MNNDTIEFLKYIGLNNYDVDKNKTSIVVDPSTFEVKVDLFLNRRMIICPYCKSTHTVIKETRVKIINHCIKPQQKISIFFHQKRFICKDCNHSFIENNPIGETISYIGLIEMFNALRNPITTFSKVSQDYFIPLATLLRYFDKRVKLSRHRLTKVLCFDEIYSTRLTKTKYSFCMYDPLSNTLLDIVPARLKTVLEEYFIHIPANERLIVQYVNIDMWKTYLYIAERFFPNATICVDSFHVIEHLTKAMDKIRLKVQRRFVKDKESDRNGYYWLLKSFHYYFTKDLDKIKYTRRERSHYSYLYDKYQVLAKLLSIDYDLAEAYRLKEAYREFNLTEEYSQDSIYELDDFIEKFKKSKFIEFREFGIMLDNWKIYIVNSFIRVNGKRMSNGPMESLNGRLKRLLNDGYGYCDFERFRNRALFSLNRDEPINLKD